MTDWLEFIAKSTGDDKGLMARVQQVVGRFPEPRRENIYEAVATAAYDHAGPAKATEASHIACYLLDLSLEGLSGLDDDSFDEAVTEMGISANRTVAITSQQRLLFVKACLETVLNYAPQLKGDFEPLISMADGIIEKASEDPDYGREGVAEMDKFSGKIIATLRDYAAKARG